MAEDPEGGGEKSEEPTEKKKGKAREEGQTAQSQELKSLAVLAGALAFVAFIIGFTAQHLLSTMLPLVAHIHEFPTTVYAIQGMMAGLAIDVLIALSPALGLFVVLALVAGIGQVGLMWTPKAMQPKLNKLNPITGAKNLISKQKIVNLLKDITKLLLIGLAFYFIVVPKMPILLQMPRMDLIESVEVAQELIIFVLIAVCVVMMALALFDFVYQRYEHNEKLKMTKQEVKDENKQAEGDPKIKARIRQIRYERYKERMMQAVPHADVVITNPTHFAVALKYDMETMDAPTLVAKGQDFLAQQIRTVAEENEVPIVENPPLARALYASVELDQTIPVEHYKAVAEVIGYVWRLKNKMPASKPKGAERQPVS